MPLWTSKCPMIATLRLSARALFVAISIVGTEDLFGSSLMVLRSGVSIIIFEGLQILVNGKASHDVGFRYAEQHSCARSVLHSAQWVRHFSAGRCPQQRRKPRS